jgi:hypothetical protein
MDAVRLFLRSTSFRNSKSKTDLTIQYSRTQSIPDGINNSNNNLTSESQDDQSSSSEKLSHETVKSFFLTHPSSTTVLHQVPKSPLELETCSGLSTSEKSTNAIVAASAFESIAAARSFTNHPSAKRRQSSIVSNEFTRSWIAEQNIHHHISSLSPPFRRTRSSRYPYRIRKHSIKPKHSTGMLTRRHSQVNR